MLKVPNTCLFPFWQENSVPVVPTNGFWPIFSTHAINDYLSSRSTQPTPSRGLDHDGLAQLKGRVEDFLAKLEQFSAADYPCKQAYQDFEHERLASLNLILESHNTSAVEYYNTKQYGSLEDLHAKEALSYLKQRVSAMEPQTTAAAKARDALLKIWDDIQPSTKIEELFAELNAHRTELSGLAKREFGFVDDLIDSYRPAKTLSPQDTQAILNATIRRRFGEGSHWQTIIKDGAPNVHINYGLRAVVLPAGRNYTLDHVYSLAVHEVGVHVTRSIHGEASREPLAGYGMAGYGPAEEAFGVLFQHATKPSHDFVNSVVPFAVLDFANRLEEPAFRAIHELVANLLLCLANPSPQDLESLQNDLDRAAFSRTIRAYRLGTHRVVDRSTTKYWGGLMILRQYFDTHGLTDETVQTFLLGKYNPLSRAELSLIRHHTLPSM